MKNNFHYWIIFQNSTDFELNQRFHFKFELSEIYSLRLTTNVNPTELKHRQVVLHDDLQTLHSNLVDIYSLTPHIEEVIEFQRKLIVKLNLKKIKSENCA
jgi:hypothetical protein